MVQCVADMVDFDRYQNFTPLRQTTYTTLSIGQKTFPPRIKYFFKRFNYVLKNAREQKLFVHTFYKIAKLNYQTLFSYKKYSFFDCSIHPNPSLVRKYVSSTTLQDVISDPSFNSTWLISDVMNCIFAVSTGLAYLHKRLLYHGNLCPSNIVVDSIKQCYVADFGLYPIKSLFMPNEALMNQNYKAPEMTNYCPSDKADVYAFGILLCNILTPFFSIFTNESLKSLVEQRRLRELPNFPTIFKDIIPLCLDSNPEKRPSFSKIIDFFQNKSFVVSSKNVSSLFNSFMKSNYIINLANSNDANALNKLGDMYLDGDGVPIEPKKALECFKKAAELGHSEAQSNYGVCIQEGIGQEEDKATGAIFLKRSAEQGNIHGIANYGVALSKGDGVEVNIEKAEYYLKKAADLGNSYAQVEYGLLLQEQKSKPEKVVEGIKYIKMAADQGDPDGLCTFGVCLAFGDGIEKNEELAMDYIKIAVNQNFSRAHFEYAKGYLDGRGVPQNDTIALRHFEIAYEQGYEDAKYYIDLLHARMPTTTPVNQPNEVTHRIFESTNNTPKKRTNTKQKRNASTMRHRKSKMSEDAEPVTGTTLKSDSKIEKPTKVKVSSEKGHSDLEKNINSQNSKSHSKLSIPVLFTKVTPHDELVNIFKQMKKEMKQNEDIYQKKEDFDVFKYEDQFIETQDPEILYQYGKVYDKSYKFMAEDQIKATKYFEESAKLGHAGAQANYGVSLQEGNGVPQNVDLGFHYLEESAKQGNLNGMSNYGMALIQGDGPRKDIDEGLRILKEAADKGYPHAELIYGLNLQDLSQDEEKKKEGAEYIKRAADKNFGDAPYNYAICLKKGEGIPKNLPNAIEIFEAIFVQNNRDIDALEHLIESLEEIKDMKKALYYRKILADQFFDTESMYIYGNALIEGNYIEKNEELGNQYIKKSKIKSKKSTKSARKTRPASDDKHSKSGPPKSPSRQSKKPPEFPLKVKGEIEVFLSRNGQANQAELDLVSKAYQGDDEAMVEVGKLLDQNDLKKYSHYFYKNAAELNNPEGLNLYGKALFYGDSMRKQVNYGLEFLKKAAESNSDYMLDYIICYSKNNKLTKEMIDTLIKLSSEKHERSMLFAGKSLFPLFPVIARNCLDYFINNAKSDEEKLYKTGHHLIKYHHAYQEGYSLLKELASKNFKAAYWCAKSYQQISPLNIDMIKQYLTLAQNYKDSQSILQSILTHQQKVLSHTSHQSNSQNKSTTAINVCSKTIPTEKKPKQQDNKNSSGNQQSTQAQTVQQQPSDHHRKHHLLDLQKLLQNQLQQQKQQQIQMLIQQQKIQQQQLLQKQQEHPQLQQANQNPCQPRNPNIPSEIQPSSAKTAENNPGEDIDSFLELNLPPEEIIKKGDELLSHGYKSEAEQCYNEAMKHGIPLAYFKSAELATDIDEKVDLYFFAMKNNVEGSFDGWRKSIMKLARVNKSLIDTAKKFEKENDYIDAAILYEEANQKQQFSIAYNKAKESLSTITSGQQLYDFAVLLEKKHEIPEALDVFKKSEELGEKSASNKVKQLSLTYARQLRAKSKDSEGSYNLGIAYLTGTNDLQIDYKKALHFLQKSSEQGNDDATVSLGLMYFEGLGVEKNLEEAAKYFKSAADAGNPAGQNKYGDCLRLSYGVSQDTRKALAYYKLAADNGYAIAQFNFGMANVYDEDLGVDQDRSLGIEYLKKAADNGHPEAMYHYSCCIDPVNPDTSKEYLEKAAYAFDTNAIREWGDILISNGSPEKAAALFKAAADNNITIGYLYARCLSEAVGVEYDIELAEEYYRKAAETGDPEAMFAYATFLMNEDKNKDIMAKYFELSSLQGNCKAYYYYAQCLENGDGIQQNKEEAKKYYHLSLESDPESPAKMILALLRNREMID
ncbi:hypothetical protein TRFO_19738 [Tritrichomonas foetus]|uniref:Protein kinase domain-containing protein n=1 Tax=Tritrichomonas foetus TaxID=1144522 RepID=A0A1J4KMC5_9EUKA|nr:hypothetical protein TRFO_19738 [Tritrichomonas foetus]|eukprot:OHT10846.1 hypothetical protein TRFO_19738 [Tritrichomonas foetus]